MSVDIPGRLILALCNYQEVHTNPVINDLVNQLLQHLPPHCMLLIESRAIPNLTLVSLIASQRMFALGKQDLQFSPQEVKTLAQVQGLSDCSEQEAEQIVATFDGWITGILLGSRLSSSQP